MRFLCVPDPSFVLDLGVKVSGVGGLWSGIKGLGGGWIGCARGGGGGIVGRGGGERIREGS